MANVNIAWCVFSFFLFPNVIVILGHFLTTGTLKRIIVTKFVIIYTCFLFFCVSQQLVKLLAQGGLIQKIMFVLRCHCNIMRQLSLDL